MNVVFYDYETKDDLCNWCVDGFPSIHAGDIVSLRIAITPIGEEKFPNAKEHRRQLYEVREARHMLAQTFSNDISTAYHMEICVKAFWPPPPTPPPQADEWAFNAV